MYADLRLLEVAGQAAAGQHQRLRLPRSTFNASIIQAIAYIAFYSVSLAFGSPDKLLAWLEDTPSS